MAARFIDKVILITGASSGIGFGTALRFAREGAKLSVTGRNKEALSRLVDECKKLGATEDRILTITGDLRDDKFRESMVSETVNKFGRLDIFINNAGILKFGTCEATTMETFDNLFEVNVRVPFHLINLVIPHLRKTKGNIVNVSSVSGTSSFAGSCVYNMTKSAVDQLTKTVALEVASDGVRVNAVNPGAVITDLQRRGGFDDEQYAVYLENAKKSHPLGRAANVEEIAANIAFLASEEASFCTGNLHGIDGGRGLR